MSRNLATYPISSARGGTNITGPNLFDVKIMDKLTANRLNHSPCGDCMA